MDTDLKNTPPAVRVAKGAAIKTPVRAASAKARAPRDVKPVVVTPSQPPTEEAVSELQTIVWDLCSPLQPEEYVSPWTDIGKDLWGQLGRALRARSPYDVVRRAVTAQGEYADCMRILLKDAPVVYRVAHGIRGIALAGAPDELEAKNNAPPVYLVPGEALQYEELVI